MPETLFKGFKAQALRKPQGEHNVFLLAAAFAVVNAFATVKGFKAARRLKPTSVIKRMGCRADPDVFAASPVKRVMAALKARNGKV